MLSFCVSSVEGFPDAYKDPTVNPRLGLVFEQEETFAVIVELHSIVPNSSTRF
jgi:hypothetical protein